LVARFSILGALVLLSATICRAQSPPSSRGEPCGQLVTLETHARSTTRYAFGSSPGAGAQGVPFTLVLLPGGSGHVDLGENGCPSALKGNLLVRSIPLFRAAGFNTALVDAPSDHQDEDGLGGFRITTQHADDIGEVIADLRTRTQGSVWLAGTSRGSISAANAAARLTGRFAPDGVVLTSSLMSGDSAARKKWVAQSVFDVPLEDIRLALLLVGHAADQCVRSPANLMDSVMARTHSARRQVVTVVGGPGYSGSPSIHACEGRAPHGFVDQEAEVVSGIGRFIRGGNF